MKLNQKLILMGIRGGKRFSRELATDEIVQIHQLVLYSKNSVDGNELTEQLYKPSQNSPNTIN